MKWHINPFSKGSPHEPHPEQGQHLPSPARNQQAKRCRWSVRCKAWLGVGDPENLQIFGGKAGVLGDTGKHSGANFFAVVKREDVVGPSVARQSLMRSRLALEFMSLISIGRYKRSVLPDDS